MTSATGQMTSATGQMTSATGQMTSATGQMTRRPVLTLLSCYPGYRPAALRATARRHDLGGNGAHVREPG
jgi:hypothetical protein